MGNLLDCCYKRKSEFWGLPYFQLIHFGHCAQREGFVENITVISSRTGRFCITKILIAIT